MDRNEKKIALHKQINAVTEELSHKATGWKNLGRDSLVIGGIVLAGYSLMRLFDSTIEENKSEENTSQNGPDSILFSALKGAAASALLAVAKSKLTDYLDNSNADNA